MKDIILKIKDEDGIEFITPGRLFSKGQTMLIQYDETELSGMEGCTTSLTITPTKIRMRRNMNGAKDATEMIFEKGRRVHAMYFTPYGNFGMEILTNNISSLNNPSGEVEKLSIDYSISLKGFYDTHKTLDIEVYEKDSLLVDLGLNQGPTDPFREAMSEISRLLDGGDRHVQ